MDSEKNTKKNTEKDTEKDTEKATEKDAEMDTEKNTEKNTEESTVVGHAEQRCWRPVLFRIWRGMWMDSDTRTERLLPCAC